MIARAVGRAGRMWLEHFVQDVRYGARTLWRNPAFAATTILTLSIGLALTTALFTVFNAYLLRPFAVRDPQDLHRVVLHARDAAGPHVRWRDYEAIRDRRDLFSDAIAESTRYLSFKGRPLAAELVSGNYFTMLAPEIAQGRALTPADEDGNAVVVAHHVWTTMFARDPHVIGREIELNGRAFVIVGVLGERFAGLHAMPRDIWVPLRAYAAVAAPDLLADEARAVDVTVRLRRGHTREQAQSAIATLAVDLVGREQQPWMELRPHDKATPVTLRLLAVLAPVFAAFALVLFAACANVSSVLLARAVARQREIAVRLSLGAGRGRIIRQLMTEGLLMSLVAAVVALALTWAGLRVATALFFSTLPPSLAALLRTAPLTLDHRVFLFACAAALLSTLFFALVPAVQAARPVVAAALGAYGSRGQRSSRFRAALVAGQVAISLWLVVPALSLARNGAMIRSADVGFDVNDVVSLNVREGDPVERSRRVFEVLASDPRVAHVAVSNGNPLFGPPRRVVLDAGGMRTATPFTFISPDYFATLGIPMVRGRGFLQYEADAEAHVAIVSTAAARRFWPGQDPIGKPLRIASEAERPQDELSGYSIVTVVGVAGDIISGLIVDGPEPGHVYLPTRPGSRHAQAVLARARAPRGLGADALHEILKRTTVDPEVFEALPLVDLRTLQVYPFMAASWIGSLLGLTALVLSVSGLFGVLTYAFAQRSREIGIRMALGATAGAVVRMVMRQTASLTAVGAAAGVTGAFAVLHVIGATVRFNAVSLIDTLAFAGGLVLVGVAAALAAWHPARRAASVNPAETLRADP